MAIRSSSTLSLLLLAMVLGACTPPPAPDSEPGDGCPSSAVLEPGKIDSIGFEDFFLRQQSGELLLIDARDSWFYRQGRIPGAINIPTGDGMDRKLQALQSSLQDARERGHPIIVYCNGFGCHDARTVLMAISRMGYDCTKFGGGWVAWKKADLPIESASQEDVDLPTQAAS